MFSHLQHWMGKNLRLWCSWVSPAGGLEGMLLPEHRGWCPELQGVMGVIWSVRFCHLALISTWHPRTPCLRIMTLSIIYKTNILAFCIVFLRVQMSWPSYSMFLPNFSRTTKTTRWNCNEVLLMVLLLWLLLLLWWIVYTFQKKKNTSLADHIILWKSSLKRR